MVEKNPYRIIKRQQVTEKAQVLQQLKTAQSNKSVKRCESPKYVFIVDKDANKTEIAWAVEQLYHELHIKVVKVNTLNVKGKRRRVRGRSGFKACHKKAVVTLSKGDNLDKNV